METSCVLHLFGCLVSALKLFYSKSVYICLCILQSGVPDGGCLRYAIVTTVFNRFFFFLTIVAQRSVTLIIVGNLELVTSSWK